ncbi:MAG: DUF3782 domain-containing protein [Proteobacteria bacterium]|nr:DUF3782 domain-containing protein [Pseudomonadota bacterium]
MQPSEIKELIKRELPLLLQKDRELQEFIVQLSKTRFADKQQTEDRFDRILNELKQDREEQSRKWAEQAKRWEESNREQNKKWEEQDKRWEESNREQNKKWDEQDKRWEELNREQNKKWDEQNKKWDEQNKKWDEQNNEQNKKWDEQNKKWDEQNKKWDEQNIELNNKWDEQNRHFDQVHEEIMAMTKKHQQAVGALGSRWGIYSEESFRDGLKAILNKSFGVEVINYNDYDDTGEVFGRPDQIELDILIKDGHLIICELKSSISKSDMYMFEKKARFYEKKHSRTADRLITISPMTDQRALEIAKTLGIEAYTSSYDAKPNDLPESH